MDTQLQPWKSPPRKVELLAVYFGPRPGLEQFVKLWQDVGGDVNLLARRISGTNEDGEKVHGCAIFIEQLPALYSVIDWAIVRPSWRLYYRRRNNDNGVFWPWGLEPQELGKLSPNGKLQIHDGRKLFQLPPLQEFDHFFAAYADRVPLMMGRGGTEFRSAMSAKAADTRAYVLRMGLQDEDPTRHVTNPDALMVRLQDEVKRLEEQIDVLRTWKVEPVRAQVFLYPETENYHDPGSVWRLRDWYIRASDAAIGKFNHCRVVVKDLGPMHVVLPKDLDKDPEVNLPPPRHQVVLDPHWRRKGRTVFVQKGCELRPAPPNSNKHVENLLANCLWDGAEASRALIVLKCKVENTERIVRFDLPNTQSLTSQTKTLNIQSGIQHADRLTGEERADGLHPIVARIHAELQGKIAAGVKAIEDLLRNQWERRQNDLDRYRQLASEAIVYLQDIETWRKQFHDLREKEFDDWRTFRRAMLELDRELAPTDETREEIEAFDGLRESLPNLWVSDSHAARQRFAEQLRELADRIDAEPSDQSPPLDLDKLLEDMGF